MRKLPAEVVFVVVADSLAFVEDSLEEEGLAEAGDSAEGVVFEEVLVLEEVVCSRHRCSCRIKLQNYCICKGN